MRSGVASLVLGMVLAACTASSPVPSPTVTGTPSASPSNTPRPTASPTTSEEPGLEITPDTPFTADEILDAMRESRRPGGVPDAVETEAVASALADAIWTFDGEPWTAIVAGGSCGAASCTLEIAGAPEGSEGEDLWVFAVDPVSGEVRVADSTLRGLDPTVTAAAADIVAQSRSDPGADAFLSSARWLPPPDEGLVVLSYRTGAETGACGVDLTVDLRDRIVVDRASIAC